MLLTILLYMYFESLSFAKCGLPITSWNITLSEVVLEEGETNNSDYEIQDWADEQGRLMVSEGGFVEIYIEDPYRQGLEMRWNRNDKNQ